MKKYEAPVLEIIQIEQINHLTAGTEQGCDADAKHLDTELIEDSDLWNTDSWETNYSLWDEE